MDGAGPRVLYIDDDPGLVRLVRRALAARGYAVEHAADPEEGLARIRAGGIAAVALDHHMPGRTGLDVLAAIRVLPDPPPVIYVTGSEDSHVAVAALKGGAADYVWKDVEGHFRELLAQALDGALDQARLRREAARAQEEVARLNALLSAQVDERTRERDRLWRLSRDLFAIIGFDGRLRSVNPAAETILARPLARIEGHDFRDFVHPDDLPFAEEAQARLVLGQPIVGFEMRFGRPDGSWRHLAWTAVSEDGLIYGTARDVTDQRGLEDQLRQAQRIEALGQLTGGIAHDFNNLLQGVSGSLDLIRRRADDPARVRALAEAGLEAASRGARLTAQLLAFSRDQRLEERPVPLDSLVEGMRELLDRTLGPLVAVRIAPGAPGAAVVSDPTQLEMAVLNLAINARDAMPEGGAITIATRPLRIEGDPELLPGDYVELSVADEGSGMPPEVAARAFEPFYTTKGPGRGTGLGLSQVFGIARLGGGTARIESRPGQGTIVRLLLRRTEAGAGTEAAGPSRPEALGRAATVLVVDDDADVRHLLGEQVAILGARPELAADGPAALAALRRGRPDLLLVDYAMPGMTGAEVVQEARRLWPGLPVVFATGYADSRAIEEAAGGAARILRKPFRLADLAEALREALREGAPANG
jgi:PAS domain S-box-containing protein